MTALPADMPWAEPPPQPARFDARDAAEAEEFAARHERCPDCGYRLAARGHRRECGGDG